MSDKNDTRAMLLGASPWKLVLSLSVPAIIGMVVVGLYNLMDASCCRTWRTWCILRPAYYRCDCTDRGYLDDVQ